MRTLYARIAVAALLLVVTIVIASVALAQNGGVAPVIVGDPTLESVQVVLDFTETQDVALYAPDAELLTAFRPEAISGRDAITDFLAPLYGGRGNILGAFAEPTRVIAVGDSIVICEYVYHATAFIGDHVPLETMFDSVTLEVPMVSIYEVENGLIKKELLFMSGSIPPLLAENVG